MMGAVSWLLCLIPVARQVCSFFLVPKREKGRLRDSQFARRLVIDPLIGCERGYRDGGKSRKQ
jgi:hypothetical protein